MPKSKKTTRSFTISDFKGSFSNNTNIPLWKIVLFVNHYFSHIWHHRVILECLNISLRTSVDWRSFCSEVTDTWFNDQDSIRGEGVEVEIDETVIVCRKFNRGRVLKQLWLFGGIEGLSKRRFVVALNGPTGDKRNSATHFPLIEKYIKLSSIIQWCLAGVQKHQFVRFTLQTFCHQPLRKFCDFWRNPHTDNRKILARSQRMD